MMKILCWNQGMEEKGEEEGNRSTLIDHPTTMAGHHTTTLKLPCRFPPACYRGTEEEGPAQERQAVRGTWRGEFIESTNTAVQHISNTDSLLTGYNGLRQKSRKLLFYLRKERLLQAVAQTILNFLWWISISCISVLSEHAAKFLHTIFTINCSVPQTKLVLLLNIQSNYNYSVWVDKACTHPNAQRSKGMFLNSIINISACREVHHSLSYWWS